MKKYNVLTAAIMAVTLVAIQVTGTVKIPILSTIQTQAAQIQRQTIAAGSGVRPHTAVIKNDGSLWTWGDNEYGQLGDGYADNDGLIHFDGSNGSYYERNTPKKVMDNVVSVDVGGAHTTVIKNDGSLWTWGYNTDLELEWHHGGIVSGIISPVKVMNDAIFVSAAGGLDASAITMFPTGDSAAIKKDGSLWTWGDNSSSSPTKVMSDVVAVSSGGGHTAAIKNDSSLWTWGSNDLGQLGDGTTTDRNTPQKIMDNVAVVSTEHSYSAAIKTDGSLWTWGNNERGQLGDGTTTDRSIPKKIMDNVIAVSVGGDFMNRNILDEGIKGHMAAIKTDGSLWTWGNNQYGELGDGTTTDRHTPVKIMDDVVEVSAGHGYTIALKSDGSLWSWGENELLDDITNIDRHTPVKIMDDVMLPSNAVIPNGTGQQNTTPQPQPGKAEYIYNTTDIGDNIVFLPDIVNSITSEKTAISAIETITSEFTSEEKENATARDKVALVIEAIGSNSNIIQSKNSTITIDDKLIGNTDQNLTDFIRKLVSALESDNMKLNREPRKVITIQNNTDGSIQIDKSKIAKNVDEIKVKTNYAAVTVDADDEINIKLENKGNHKIAVDFGQTDATIKIKIAFLGIPEESKYMAIVDENGNAIGGKYNATTGELETKINKSGVYTIMNNEKNFSDIAGKTEEMKEAIKVLTAKGIMNGTSDTKFSPDQPISRAEVASIIVKTISKYDANENGGYKDVQKNDWYFGAAGSAKRYDIMSGYPDNTFRGNNIIPKDQLVATAARTLKTEMNYYTPSNVDFYLNEYKDSNAIPRWAKSDIALATQVNMVLKRADGYFVPNEQMTRGDAAIILKRLFDRIW